MSAVAAVVSWDGSDGAPLLQRLVEAGRHRAPDGVTSWTDGAASLAKLHRLALPGQSVSAQPAVERHGPHVVVFDGRLDRGGVAAPEDDVSIALDAVVRAGARAVDDLDGEFALIAWNARARTLVAARDRMGIRPVYWTRLGAHLLIASEIRQLLGALPQTPPPDLHAVAQLLAFEPETDERTLYTGIARLPPGHVLEADARGVRTRRYWRAEPSPPGAARRDEAYEEECRALLDRAVRERLRATSRPVLFFSGGIDSSSVLATALRVAPPDPLRPLSMVFDAPETQESEFRAAFAAATGVRAEEITAAPFDPAAYMAQAAFRRLPPDLPSQFHSRPMRARAAALGARVALTGEGGDVVFGGTTFVYADLLRAGRVAEAVKRHRLDATYDDGGWSRLGLLTEGVWPLLPHGVRRQLRGPLGRLAGARGAVSWLRLPIPERDAVPAPPRGVPMAGWAIAWELNRGWTALSLESLDRDAAEWGLEARHPLFDPPLVQFALSLPEDQRRRGRLTKYVLRRAARLPPPIGARTTKADLSSTLQRLLDAYGGAAFMQGLEIAAAGWVDADEARRGYDVVRQAASLADPVPGALIARLWLLAAVEVWFRAVYGSGRIRVEDS
jgi:asparagine synthase (glutamine-hydrolysing)